MNYNFIRSHRASQILKDFLISNGINHHWLIPRNICPIVLKVFNSLSINYSLIDICENGLINLNKIGNERVNYGCISILQYCDDGNVIFLPNKEKLPLVLYPYCNAIVLPNKEKLPLVLNPYFVCKVGEVCFPHLTLTFCVRWSDGNLRMMSLFNSLGLYITSIFRGNMPFDKLHFIENRIQLIL